MRIRYAVAALFLVASLVFPAFSEDITPSLSGTISFGDSSNEVVSARATYWFEKAVSISLYSTEKPFGKAFARIMIEFDENRTDCNKMSVTYAYGSGKNMNKQYSETGTAENGKLKEMLLSFKLENNMISFHTKSSELAGSNDTQAQWDIKIENLPVK